jgi:hypothetical protein
MEEKNSYVTTGEEGNIKMNFTPALISRLLASNG